MLGAVDMAQGHIVKGVKYGCIHVVRPAHGDVLRIRTLRAGNELMGYQHVPPGRVNRHLPDGRAQSVRVGGYFAVREKPPDMGGLQEGEHVEIHSPEGVRQGEGLDLAAVDR